MNTALGRHPSGCEAAGEGQRCAEPRARSLAPDLLILLAEECPTGSLARGESCWEPSKAPQERLSACIPASLIRSNNGHHPVMVLKTAGWLLEAKSAAVSAT